MKLELLFVLAAEIIQISDSIAWVRCASGYIGCMYIIQNKYWNDTIDHLKSRLNKPIHCPIWEEPCKKWPATHKCKTKNSRVCLLFTQVWELLATHKEPQDNAMCLKMEQKFPSEKGHHSENLIWNIETLSVWKGVSWIESTRTSGINSKVKNAFDRGGW